MSLGPGTVSVSARDRIISLVSLIIVTSMNMYMVSPWSISQHGTCDHFRRCVIAYIFNNGCSGVLLNACPCRTNK